MSYITILHCAIRAEGSEESGHNGFIIAGDDPWGKSMDNGKWGWPIMIGYWKEHGNGFLSHVVDQDSSAAYMYSCWRSYTHERRHFIQIEDFVQLSLKTSLEAFNVKKCTSIAALVCIISCLSSVQKTKYRIHSWFYFSCQASCFPLLPVFMLS